MFKKAEQTIRLTIDDGYVTREGAIAERDRWGPDSRFTRHAILAM